MTAEVLLDAQGIVKRFGGITALSNVGLTVHAGEAVGLVGPNGAGKTTLFNCLLGMLRPEEGAVTFRGTDITRLPTHRRAKMGIGRTFQRLELFSGMTPREHLLVAERSRRADGRLWKDIINRGGPTAAEHARAQEVIDLLRLDHDADQPIEALSLGRGRIVEMARALMSEPVLLMLDEPSSGLDRVETAALVAVLKQVQRERGTAILLVEHDLEMVQQVAERLYVLNFGMPLASGTTAAVLANPDVRSAYLGSAAVGATATAETATSTGVVQ